MRGNKLFDIKKSKLSYRSAQDNANTHHSKTMFVLWYVQILAGAISAFTIFMCIWLEAVEPLLYLIPAIFADASVVTVLVVWKRKHENIFAFLSEDKIKGIIEWLQSIGIDPADFFRAFKE